ncbi:thiamine-phosphate kinase [Paramicrobacterium sp. CJ85]|uniref:thiamine-phosphate kinase n=1 Tax=Paramicrobacterium sp. CJ85 TaxID=3445355 RepID=UPI003F5E3FCA
MVFSDRSTGPSLSELTEGRVLERIFPRLPLASAALLGPGDDCAMLRAPDGRYVVTTDMMVHGPDFREAWSTPFDLGWKAAATNLSDVAAMGARPTGLVIALAVPDHYSVSVLENFADGVRAACAELAPGCGVVGGDLSTSRTFTIAVTAFGDLEGRSAVLRSGARVGDIVAVSGTLGAAARGLSLLFAEGVNETGEPDAERAGQLRERHPDTVGIQLAPRPPIGDGAIAAHAGVTAMMDLSDGLALDASRLARASGVTLSLESAKLGPADEAVLHGGEDHGLLACFPADADLPTRFRRIGVVSAPSDSDVTLDGAPLDARGWDPYANWDGNAG